MNINGYEQTTEFKNTNSGFSKWCFAKKGGREYFIKQLIKPVFPIDRSVMSEQMFNSRRESCYRYENRAKMLYENINRVSRGNLVRTVDFFRNGSRYYLVTEKIKDTSLTVEYMATLSENKNLLFLKTIAYCFADLHSADIIHSDVKPSNLIIQKTQSGNYCAKLIDFDSCFFKDEKLNFDEIEGDLVYLAPEKFVAMTGKDITLDEKSDIFAIGVMFYEYYCGKLPEFDTQKYRYPYEAVLDGKKLKLETETMPERLTSLIGKCLDNNPSERPSAKEIIAELDKIISGNDGTLDIESVTICFGIPYGKQMTLTKEAILYQNIYTPLSHGQDSDAPYSFFEQKQTALTEGQFDELLNVLCEKGMLDIVEDKFFIDNHCYKLICKEKSGKIRTYYADYKPNKQFENIADILSRYCDFPKLVPKSEPEPVPLVEKNAEDWFNVAGDL